MIAFIYIPICLYLNIKDVAANYGITGIYIPICLYLNKGGEIVDKTIDRIYIPICLYLNPSPGFPLFFYLIPQLSVDQPKFTNILPYLPH